MLRKNSILFVLAFLIGGAVFAQERSLTAASPRSPKGIIRCISSEYEQSLRDKYPGRSTQEEFEAWLAPLVAKEKAKRTAENVNTVSTIPVVVHVIYKGTVAVGTGGNISDARVASEITVLNQDFRRATGTPGFNSNPIGADAELEFCLAQRTPTGAATNGIDRVSYTSTNFATTASVETMKTATQWDPTQYFNIWVVAFSTSSSAELGGVLGYAQFPEASGLGGFEGETFVASTDGVVIDYRCFGTSDIVTSSNYFSDYDKGRTATHEIGHCFGLLHIWGDNSSCSVNTTDSNKDYCPDTPAANTAHYDCASTYDTCAANAGNDMTENYMDYSNDTCMNTFTLDQKARFTAVMNNSPRRVSLKTSNACQAPLSTEEFKFFEQIKIYPNPVKDMMNIKSSNSELPDAYTIFNSLGEVVAYQRVKSVADLSRNVASFQTGVYFVRVWKGENVKTYQLIKE